jgi:hypothetical protein
MAETGELVETNELTIVAKNSGLEQSKIGVLLAKFGQPFQDAMNIIDQAQGIQVTNENQKDEIEQAGFARKELKRLRCEVENTRKELKEQSLREGKAIDGMANVIKAVIVPVEEKLEEQEKFAQRAAAKRLAEKLEERRIRLAEYTDQPGMYKFEDSSDAEFDELINSLKEARDIQVAAQKKAEEDRIAVEKAAAAEQERIRQENEKLKAEAAAREAQLAKERKAEEAARVAERAEQEKKLAAERAIAEEERKKREALEAEQQAQAKAEAAAKVEAEEKARTALLAPDKDKLMKFADTLDALVLPNVADREAGKVLDETKDFLGRVSKNLRIKASQL